MNIKEQCQTLRREILPLVGRVRELSGPMIMVVEDQPVGPEPDYGEILANVELAYRHLEDARMRLGKAIQAYEGGVSRYDD